MVGGVGIATCCICKGLRIPKSNALALDSSPSENLADNWPLYGVPPLNDSRDQGPFYNLRVHRSLTPFLWSWGWGGASVGFLTYEQNKR